MGPENDEKQPDSNGMEFRVIQGHTKVYNPHIKRAERPQAFASTAFKRNFTSKPYNKSSFTAEEMERIPSNLRLPNRISGPVEIVDLADNVISLQDVQGLESAMVITGNGSIKNLNSVSSLNLDSETLSSLNIGNNIVSELSMSELGASISIPDFTNNPVVSESFTSAPQSFEVVDSNTIPLLSLAETEDSPAIDAFPLLDFLENGNMLDYENPPQQIQEVQSVKKTPEKKKRRRKPPVDKNDIQIDTIKTYPNINSKNVNPTLTTSPTLSPVHVATYNVPNIKSESNEAEIEISETSDIKPDITSLAEPVPANSPVGPSNVKVELAPIEEVDIGAFLKGDQCDNVEQPPESDPFAQWDDIDPLASPEPVPFCHVTGNSDHDVTAEEKVVEVNLDQKSSSLATIMEKLEKCDTVVLKKIDDMLSISNVKSPTVKSSCNKDAIIIPPQSSPNLDIVSVKQIKDKIDKIKTPEPLNNLQSENISAIESISTKLEKCNTVIKKAIPDESNFEKNATTKSNDKKSNLTKVDSMKETSAKSKINESSPFPLKTGEVTIKSLKKPINNSPSHTNSKKNYSPIIKMRKQCKIALQQLEIPSHYNQKDYTIHLQSSYIPEKNQIPQTKIFCRTVNVPRLPPVKENMDHIYFVFHLTSQTKTIPLPSSYSVDLNTSNVEDEDIQLLENEIKSPLHDMDLFSDEMSDAEDSCSFSTNINELAHSIVCQNESNAINKDCEDSLENTNLENSGKDNSLNSEDDSSIRRSGRTRGVSNSIYIARVDIFCHVLPS